ncbi:MAG: ATP-binding cassette domain-containing protein [Chloroflexota bacterium]|nr:ATP-binding cassette domain-containing protein [Chloroflexota bacterium]
MLTDHRERGTEPPVLLEAFGLTKCYGSRIVAVDHLTLAIRRGEIYGFIGPNGAGKTTTLRMLMGLIKPSAGHALVLGHSPGDPKSLRRIGAMIESPAFYPYLSGRQNLQVIARWLGVPDRRVDETLERVQLAPRSKDKFSTYSLGMKQRLGVAATLLKDPELLLLDEPTNGLDPPGMADMRVMIRALREEGRTVLLSSHLLGDVEQLCDRVGMIRGGRLIIEGTLAEVCGRPMLAVRARPLGVARSCAERMVGAERVRVEGEIVVVDADPGRAGELCRALVLAGSEVEEIGTRTRSLEAVFFELTERQTAGSESLRNVPP